MAQKIAREAASRIPCPDPLKLTREQQEAAGSELSKLLALRTAFHHSGLSYLQRAGVIEPLAKAGQLRVVVATLGLAAGINFSLRSVLITGTQYNVDGFPREVSPAELLQMFGRAGRRGLDERGYVLVADHSPRLGQAREEPLRRSSPLPWRPLLRELADGRSAAAAAPAFARRLFTTAEIPMGVEDSGEGNEEFPCRLYTDTGRARLVRREMNRAEENGAAEITSDADQPRKKKKRRRRKRSGTADDRPNICLPCQFRERCLGLDPEPTLLWLWNRLGLLDREMRITLRGRIMSGFVGPEGLGVIAGLEEESMELENLVYELADLVSGGRFSGEDSRWAGPLARACTRSFRRFSYEGFLTDGIPVNYGAGGADLVRAKRDKGYVPAEMLSEHAHRGDVDRLFIEWRSLLRQVVSCEAEIDWPRWREFKQLCADELKDDERQSALAVLPILTAEQQKGVSHRLYSR